MTHIFNEQTEIDGSVTVSATHLDIRHLTTADDSVNTREVPITTPITTNVTLTNADTDYKLPSSELASRRTIIVSNNSGYTIYIGQTGVIDCDGTPPIGIKLIDGNSISLDCSTGLYAQCDTAGAKVTVTEFA